MPLPTISKEERDKASKWLGAKLPTMSWGPKRKERSVPSSSKGRDKADASKLDATVKSLIKDLNLAGQNYTKRLQSHRDQIYDSMQTAQRVIAECLNDGFVHTSFIKALQRKAKSDGGRSFKLSLEVMALAMGATGLRARKLASKRAKVLDYLRKSGVKVQKTAATVKEEGLENLYMKAREHFGSVKTKPKPRQPSSKSEPASLTSVSRGAARAGHNDTEVAMSFMIKQSDRDQLQHSKLNTKFTVVASRVTVHDGGVRVERVALGDLLDVEE